MSTGFAIAAMVLPLALLADPTTPPPGPPHTQGTLTGIAVHQSTDGSASSESSTPTANGPHITYDEVCGIGGQAVCYAGETCYAGEVEGTWYAVLADGQPTGDQICVTPEQADDEPVITPGQVLQAFRRLHWPPSTLLIEPPGGETLVNFATNFHTDNDAPTSQTVTLLGRRITIEATPTTYTWHFGDGQSLDTDTPGRAYPHLDITHAYAGADTYGPSVDTTYTGRYRVGGGPWIAIPDTLTVGGATVALTAREARPTLVQP